MDFEDFFKNLLKDAEALAKGELKDFLTAAKTDAQAILNKAKETLQRRTRLLVEGKLSKDEFDEFVRAQIDLATMDALTQAGAAAARVQRFRTKLIDLVINSAFKTFLP